MFTKNEFEQLRKSYVEIGKMVEKYGNGQYNGIIKILHGQIRCIDSDEDVSTKTEYLVESYNRIFVSRGGLGNFVIYNSNSDIRTRLNESFNSEMKKIWIIVKQYFWLCHHIRTFPLSSLNQSELTLFILYLWNNGSLKAENITGLICQEIRNKLALLNTPKYICDVNLEVVMRLRTGEVNSLFGFSGG